MTTSPLARAAALAAAATAAAACGEPDAPAGKLTVTSPAATAEHLPGGTTELAWTWTGGAAELTIALSPFGEPPAIVIHEAAIGPGAGAVAWDGLDVDGAPVPAEVYDLHVEVRAGGALADRALKNLAVHGMTFTDPAPGATRVVAGADAPVNVRVVTVSQRVVWLVFSLDPDPEVDGDEHAFDERTIPGEFVPFERSIRFTGVDLDGAPIPAGAYTVVVDVDDVAGDAVAYRTAGGALDWRP